MNLLKEFSLILALLILCTGANAVSAQTFPARLLNAVPEAGAAENPDNIPQELMVQAVRTILLSEIEPSDEPRIVYLADTNIEPAWAPTIKGINFVLLNEKEQRGRSGYGFNTPKNKGTHFEIEFGFWTLLGCSGGGTTWNVSNIGGEVKVSLLEGSGWGHGCAVCSGDSGR